MQRFIPTTGGAGYVRRSQRIVYENPWLRLEAHEIVHPNGRPGEHALVVPPPSCGVIALDGDDVLLTRQPRFAIDRVVVEIVKGGAHGAETPLACAQRELREELGFAARRWDALGPLYEIPSIVAGVMELFLARELTAVPVAPEDVESIEIVRMPFARALDEVAAGAIADAATGAALFRAARFLER